MVRAVFLFGSNKKEWMGWYSHLFNSNGEIKDRKSDFTLLHKIS
jgi:hypothetical protein